MAVVFQEPLLLDRGVRANVEAGLALRGVPRGARRERAARWLARFGVDGLAGRSSRTLSGGEAQRVSLARAFALEPEVLFLDEPFSALDQPTRTAIIDDLAAVLSETHVTTLLVTHDHDEAARLGDVVAVMMHGRIKQAGTPSSVFGAPVDEETASFVGIETMFAARVTGAADGLLSLATPSGGIIEAVGDAGSGQALVCLRPEDVSISLPGAPGAGSARQPAAGPRPPHRTGRRGRARGGGLRVPARRAAYAALARGAGPRLRGGGHRLVQGDGGAPDPEVAASLSDGTPRRGGPRLCERVAAMP